MIREIGSEHGATAWGLPGDSRSPRALGCDAKQNETDIIVRPEALRVRRMLRPRCFDAHMAKAALPHMKGGVCIIDTGPIMGLDGRKTLAPLLGPQGFDSRVNEAARAETSAS